MAVFISVRRAFGIKDTNMGDSKIPRRNRRANRPPKLVTHALRSEQEPKPIIMRGMTRAAEKRLAAE